MLEKGLDVFWYIIVISSIISYAMLDGFDLGVGALHLFVKKDDERRIFLNAIGPVWDGNEVWLVVVVGALFAGFPNVYATLLSAFYIPITLLIFALIFRAVAIEFRSKQTSSLWRRSWDTFFWGASILIALMMGMALGNLIQGIPLNEAHEYTGTFLSMALQPYPALVGVMTLALFTMHGAIYLVMKSEGELQEKVIRWVRPAMIFFIISYAITTMVTLIYQSHMVNALRERPYLFAIALVNMLVIANIPRAIHHKKYGWAFLSSCINIALLLILFAIGLFPKLIRSSIHPENFSLTVMNSAASLKTLEVLAIIVVIGLPLVFLYGVYVYRLFRGKVQLDHTSY
jgi:cytochrome d ubiquinol oxidase subunit II